MILNIITRYLSIIDKVDKNKDKFIWRASETEMYNQYETNCFSTNFLSISLMSEDCTRSTFLPKYSVQAKTQILNGVTALEFEYKEVVILDF